jgi:ABC-2 type transport system ATP-binding protein
MLSTVDLMADAIAVSGLVKSFGHVRALDGLDLSVATGEVHGFLGPNGAGKSTTIRVLLGLQRAEAGEVTLLGGDPWRDAVDLHRRLAYVPGDVTLWPNLSGGETIDLLGRLRGGLDPARRADLLERMNLDPDEAGTGVLERQPSEGRPGRRARLRRRTAHPRRTDVGAGSADGGGVPRVHRG